MASPTRPRSPRRPLPRRVYWVRRALVLVVALGLVVGVARLLGGAGGASDDAARVVGSEPAPSTRTAASQPTADVRPGREGREGRGGRDRPGKPRKTRTPLAVPTGPCRNEQVVVAPKLREDAHAGRTVHFRLKLTTTGVPACTWTVSPETLVVKITSGDDRIWSSQDCPDAVPQTDVVVRKDVPAKVDMGWRGQRSDSECSRLPAWALPGFYYVQTAAYGAEPADVQFELEPAVVPTRTAKPKPEKDGDGTKKDGEQRDGAERDGEKKKKDRRGADEPR